jgi:exodeoxyribonuclease VII small subunit
VTDEPTSYTAALEELESIVRELDGDQVDVDRLATRVERAAVLIQWCRARVAAARLQVEQVVAELDEP